ncbi:MAG: MerR family transcriptional regulator [Verrucomicrobiales bacterium]|nr:MerR family transcriptional regulator [Verrucomicrobiales bacterium]
MPDPSLKNSGSFEERLRSPEDFSLAELADAVNEWCLKAGLKPANGQVGESLTERNIRFYRTAGIVDGPRAGGGRGYDERHLLQLTAIRILQAQGIPLRRIRELLFGRSLPELREIRDRGRAEAARSSSPSLPLVPGDSWQLQVIANDVALLHRPTTTVTPEQLRRIREILAQ